MPETFVARARNELALGARKMNCAPEENRLFFTSAAAAALNSKDYARLIRTD